ncbi:MAG: methyltransferase domain-containing protein [Candidatus Binatia bacterium]
MSGGCRTRTTCRSCGNGDLSLVLDFGRMALAGGFLAPRDFPWERTYPLQLYFCRRCFLLQVVNVVPPELLFSNYFYFSSVIRTLQEHFREYARACSERFLTAGRSFVVEIGCNDGVLLRPFRDLGMRVLGVDPAANVTASVRQEGVDVINDFFTKGVAERIVAKHGRADAVVANNVFAHIDDLHDIIRGIYRLLAPDGVFIFEAHYAGNLIGQMQCDMIYHEHLSYYSLLAVENLFRRFDMEVFDVTPVSIHAGSVRYYVRKVRGIPREKISDRVVALRNEELAKGYHRAETYRTYAAQVDEKRSELLFLLRALKANGKSIVGYGASGRANTLMQYCGLDRQIIEYMVDDAPAKHGFFTPGAHLPIRPSTALDEEPPDYVLVFAWAFVDEIKLRCERYLRAGGRLIIPLPDVQVLSFHGIEEPRMANFSSLMKAELP